MKSKELTYKVLEYDDKHHVISLCEKFNIYLDNNLIQNICSKKWDNISTNHIGYGCFDGQELIGYIGCVQAKRNGCIINDLSCGIVDEEYRGNGIATKLFSMANNDGDIILDLTPSEQVYQMFKRHFSQFRDLSDYQLWFNCKKLKKNKKATIINNLGEILNYANDYEKTLINDNIKLMASFSLIKIDDEYTIVGYYTMKKRNVIRGFEIIFISNHFVFEKYYEAIIKCIAKSNNSFVAFVDKRWLKNVSFDGAIMKRGTNTKRYLQRLFQLLFKKFIKAPNRKIAYVKSETNSHLLYDLDYLYTEMCLYKDLK